MAVIEMWHRRGRLPRPKSPLSPRPIRPGRDGWCDEPGHPAYNRHVDFPFAASAESLAREDRLYDVIVVLDWNYRERMRGRGSAIFLHVAKPGYPPTEGCIAVSPADMRRLAPLLSRRSRIVVTR